MRDPEASEVQGQRREGWERVRNMSEEKGSDPPRGWCRKQSWALLYKPIL